MKTSSPPSSDSAPEGVRLDAWLWAARFYKTRSLAKHAVETGKVEVDAQSRKPSALLRVGAAVRLVRGEETFEVRVLALSVQRRSATIAQALYRETEASRLAREAERARRRAEATGYRPPAGKPDKRARRLIQALGDIEAS